MGISRRCFIATLAVAGCAQLDMRARAEGDSVSAHADTDTIDRWMKQWMDAPKSVNNPLHLGRFADPTYYLIKEIGWEPNPGQKPEAVKVPVGFVTDFASIPRVFWSILRPDGLYTYPAIIHDYLYWEQPAGVDRATADLVLKYAMEDFKIDRLTIETIYKGVQIGGGSAWAENARLKKAGEKRLLRRTPENPTIRWSDWKKLDVFARST